MSLILAPNLRRSTNPAQMSITGSISNGVNWIETLVLTDGNGDQATGVSGDTVVLQLRKRVEDTSPDLTLSTSNELTLTEGATETTLDIYATASAVSALDACDYTIDIVLDDAIIGTLHIAHGRISVFGSPIAI